MMTSEMDRKFMDGLVALCKPLKPAILFGKEYYLVPMHPDSFHLLKCQQARANWYRYFGAVRAMRRVKKFNKIRELLE